MKHRLQKLLCVLLAGIILVCPVRATNVFPDVDEYAEYADAVEYVNSAGLMMGDDAGNFNPNETITRAEIAVILCRMLDATESLTVSDIFSDVPASHWANVYVAKVAELGIVSGYGNGKFGPSDPITYEQALKMIMNTVGLEDVSVAAGGYPDGYIAIADEYGITSQISTVKGAYLQRWEVASILYCTIA